MTWMGRLLILPPVLLGAAMIWQASAFKPAPPIAAPEERRIAVSFVTAAPRTFIPQIVGYGTVQPARVWTAIAQIPGQIAYLNPAFVRGGSVRRGEVLVRITADDTKLALSSADADLKSAEARLEEMRLSRQTNNAALDIERDSLALIEADLARTLRLAKRGVVSESVVLTQQREVLAQRAKLQSVENTLALLPAQLKAQEQSVAKADTARRAAQLDLDRTVITAPFDARVASLDVEIGQYVGIGTAIGVLDGAATAEVDVQVSQARMLALSRLSAKTVALAAHPAGRTALKPKSASAQGHAGRSVPTFAASDPRRLTARVSLTTDQGGPSWPAEVARISDAVNPETHSIGVIVRVEDPYGPGTPERRPPLMKGTFVRVALTAPPVANAILVPRSAIRSGRVMIAGRDDRLSYATVRPIFTFDTIAVLAPGALPADARIVTSDPSPALEGLLLSPQADVFAEARLAAAASGDAL